MQETSKETAMRFYTLLHDALEVIPEDATEPMCWPLIDLDDHPPFVWGVWESGGGWGVWEYYPGASAWGCNIVLEDRQAAINFVKFWMMDNCPEWGRLYFRSSESN